MARVKWWSWERFFWTADRLKGWTLRWRGLAVGDWFFGAVKFTEYQQTKLALHKGEPTA